MTLIDLQKKMLCCFETVKTTLSSILSGVSGSDMRDYGTELALGNITNRYALTTFGITESQGQGDSVQDIWLGTGVYTGQPENFTPEPVTVVSTDINDTILGTGARSVRIFGLQDDTSTIYTSETLELDGTTPVTSVNSYYRMNFLIVGDKGSVGRNIGTLTVASSVTIANIFDVVPPGLNESQTVAWTVPAKSTGVLKRLNISIVISNGQVGSAAITIWSRPPGGAYLANAPFQLSTSAPVSETEFSGAAYMAGTDIKIGFMNISDNNTFGQALIEFEVVQDE